MGDAGIKRRHRAAAAASTSRPVAHAMPDARLNYQVGLAAHCEIVRLLLER
jgi:hypothetical protein